jgi:ABC-type uncharacterized transport system substrate-binding protein
MKRRDLITLLGAGLTTWPFASRAQQSERARRIGVMLGWAPNDPQSRPFLAAFTDSLQQLGWTEGRTIEILYRWASIDVVFVTVSDPVGSGFIASLPRPGGNATGFVNLEDSLSGKWIELLLEVAPGLSRAAILFNPETAPHFNYYLRPFEAAARSHAVEPIAASVRTTDDIERVVTNLSEGPVSGLVLMPDIFTSTKRNLEHVISLSARYRLPTIYPYRYMAAAGGLISYGIDNTDLWRRSSIYVDRILKGAKPGDLPVQLPTKFELAVNLKTAKTLGLTLSQTLVIRADEVIE